MNSRAAMLAIVALCMPLAASPGSPPPMSLPKGHPADYLLKESSNVIWKVSNEEKIQDFTHGRRTLWRYRYRHWNTATGAWRDLAVPDDLNAKTAVEMNGDVVLIGARWPFVPGDSPPDQDIVWASADGTFLAGRLSAPSPDKMLGLADQSVVVIGGRTPDNKHRTNTVERVRRTGNSLEIERLPDIPGPVRHSYAVVALADGRAMVLGGTTATYSGCSGCIADTYILDPSAKTWSPGPKMIEPRASATATRLPDGSILVVGGWTPGHDWNEEASRSTERWHPGAPTFFSGPRLPVAAAAHRARWLAGAFGKHLLVAGGYSRAWTGNDSVLDFDVARNEWRAISSNCKADKYGLLTFGTLLHEGAPWAWCNYWEGMAEGKYVQLREPAAPAPIMTQADGVALRRGRAALAAAPDGSLLVAGGETADAGTAAAAVDLVGADGRVRSLPPLNHLRVDGLAFALPNRGGFLVIGGSDGGRSDGRVPRHSPPAEWLAGQPTLESNRWRGVEPSLPSATAYGQLADGNLIAVYEGGQVEQLSAIVASGGKMTIERTRLPSLNRSRSSGGDRSDRAARVLARGLPDGRIVVAGGKMRSRSIAVLNEYSLDAGPDAYVEMGDHEPARRHEIFYPTTRSWVVSADAKGAGGPLVVLDTGQVVMLTPSRISGKEREDGTWPYSEGMLEISSADGRVWQSFSPLPDVKLDERARPFVIQGELMFAGEGTDGSTTVLQWFDGSAKRWITLWQAPGRPNRSAHVGRIVVRPLPNGKRLAIPVEGR